MIGRLESAPHGRVRGRHFDASPGRHPTFASLHPALRRPGFWVTVAAGETGRATMGPFWIASALLALGWHAPQPVSFMAAPIGVRAPDTVDGTPGNPFATAFIEALGDKQLRLADFAGRLRSRTSEISRGLLSPEIAGIADADIRLGSASPAQRRVALVLVHAAYTRGWPPLHGAAVDAERVGAALRRGGFETKIIVDPSRSERAEALRWMSEASRGADVSILYATGHGMMFGQSGYLLDSDFARGWREDSLAQHALAIDELDDVLGARQANLLFFGGCRSYEWWQ